MRGLACTVRADPRLSAAAARLCASALSARRAALALGGAAGAAAAAAPRAWEGRCGGGGGGAMELLIPLFTSVGGLVAVSGGCRPCSAQARALALSITRQSLSRGLTGPTAGVGAHRSRRQRPLCRLQLVSAAAPRPRVLSGCSPAGLVA